MRSTVYRSGDALAVDLPADALSLGITEGSEVEVMVRHRHIVISAGSPDPLRIELIEWTDCFIARHRDLLEQLAC